MAELNSVREYLLHYARFFDNPSGNLKDMSYYVMNYCNESVMNRETFNDIFNSVVIYASNEIYALIKAIDILIEQEVLGVSYSAFAPRAHYLIGNPSGYNNSVPFNRRIEFNLENDILDDVKNGIQIYWITPIKYTNDMYIEDIQFIQKNFC